MKIYFDLGFRDHALWSAGSHPLFLEHLVKYNIMVEACGEQKSQKNNEGKGALKGGGGARVAGRDD